MRLLKKVLDDVLSKEEISKLISGFDVVGDIAVIKVPVELSSKKELIGGAIMRSMKNVKTVLAQVSPVSGELRLRDLEHVCGEQKTSTVHREYGCLYKVDLARTFFSPRLASERLRIAKEVREGETIVNLFGGVGPFSILIAKLQPRCKVYTIDANDIAHELAKENIILNRVSDRVLPIFGDARKVVAEGLKGEAHRVVMPYPTGAKDFLGVALQTLRPEGGTIHYYTHCKALKRVSATEKARQELLIFIPKAGITYSRIVREVGPGWYEVVLDAKVGD